MSSVKKHLGLCDRCNKSMRDHDDVMQVREGHIDEESTFVPEQDHEYFHRLCYPNPPKVEIGEISVLTDYDIMLHCLRCDSWFEKGYLMIDEEDGEVKLYCSRCGLPVAAFRKPKPELARS